MLTPIFCWVVAACSLRYKLSISQIVARCSWLLFVFYYLVPYSQYGRGFKVSRSLRMSPLQYAMLSDLQNVRQQYALLEEETHAEDRGGSLNTPQGFFDRLQMIAMDDGLINITEQGRVFGLYPIWADSKI